MKITEDDWEDEPDPIHGEMVEGGSVVMVKAINPLKRVRRMMLVLTLVIVVVVPFINWQWPPIAPFVLAVAMGFTIATNFSITIMSMSIEDKAVGLEERIVSLLEELDTANRGLDKFHTELETMNLPRLRDNIESARVELAPSLSQFSEVSWSNVAEAVDAAMTFVGKLDRDKIEKILGPFMSEKSDAFVRPVMIEPSYLNVDAPWHLIGDDYDGEFVRDVL